MVVDVGEGTGDAAVVWIKRSDGLKLGVCAHLVEKLRKVRTSSRIQICYRELRLQKVDSWNETRPLNTVLVKVIGMTTV